jgi:hypothetical protein
VPHDVIDLVPTPEHDGCALVNVARLHVENALAGSRDGFAAGLLDEHRHRVRFVHQP